MRWAPVSVAASMMSPNCVEPPRAEETRLGYNELSRAEKLLIDYIRASGRDEGQRDSLARVALSLLLAVAAQPIPDAKLPPEWDARNRRENR